jgi:hypothetical protein
VPTRVSALASGPESLKPGAMPDLAFDQPPAAVPLDRETLARQVRRHPPVRPRRPAGPHKPLLLLYALGRLKHERETEIRFNAIEAIVNPLVRIYAPWGSGAHVSYPYGRLVSQTCLIAPS